MMQKSTYATMSAKCGMRGFSLVEILVMLGIIALLTTLIIVYGVKGARQIILFREQAKMLNIIVRAKSLSISTYGQGGVPCGFGVHFDGLPQNTYFIYKALDSNADCHVAALRDYRYDSDPNLSSIMQSFQLDPAIKFTSLGATDIAFVPPNPDVFITPKPPLVDTPVSIVLGIQDDPKTVTIKVNTFGQISTQ